MLVILLAGLFLGFLILFSFSFLDEYADYISSINLVILRFKAFWGDVTTYILLLITGSKGPKDEGRYGEEIY